MLHSFESLIKKMVDRLLKKSSRPAFYRDPQRDWMLILGVSMIAILIVTVGNIYFFYKLSKGEFFSSQPTSNTTSNLLDRVLIREVNEYYDTKEQRFNDLTVGSSSPIDPVE